MTPEPRLPLPDRIRAACAICLNAINFGSGWWPTIRRRPGLSGYSTIAGTVGQDAGHPLMPEFAASLRDVGRHVGADHGSSFEAVVEAAGGSAVELATLLASWRAFADVSLYREREVPFFKRAQLAAADLDRAGVASFPDCHHLTAFADNLVPHVLCIDGILRLDEDLRAALEAEELLLHGSPAEVELRAAAVHAVELLAAASPGLSPAEIDAALWNRGRDPRYKAIPRPRCRNTAY